MDHARRAGGAEPMMRLALLLLLGVPVAGCTANASAEYAELAIGRADPVPDTQCVPLPLLPGAKIIEDLSLGAGISAQVFATPDAIDITSLRRIRRAFSSLAASSLVPEATIAATDTSKDDSLPLLKSVPIRVATTDLVTE